MPRVGCLDYAGLMLELSALFGRKVDLVSKPGLKPLIRDTTVPAAITALEDSTEELVLTWRLA